tara:strand:+ start:427 stop:1539 length:1113 start_codon:yes stop_codon:yes gene_type:complete
VIGISRLSRIVLAAVHLAVLTGCSLLPGYGPSTSVEIALPRDPSAPDPDAPRLAPLGTRYFAAVAPTAEVLGTTQVLFARHENTFSELARRHNLGYQELRDANPAVDPWLPGAGSPVFLPTMSVMPDAPRDGIVINLPSMRLLYGTREGTGPDVPLTVSSYPIGIGREGWATPLGATKVIQKVVDPAWYPPKSIRAEHAELGDPLPSVVPAGPDNPLGRHMLQLALPGYLIHGTNKPAGVGLRVSHGCIRMYPEDIETLFERVPRQTPVRIVNQPALAGWRDGELYLEVHAPLAEDERDLADEAERVIAAALARAGRETAKIDPAVVTRVVTERRGIPFPILAQNLQLEAYLARSRIVQNVDTATVTASR